MEECPRSAAAPWDLGTGVREQPSGIHVSFRGGAQGSRDPTWSSPRVSPPGEKPLPVSCMEAEREPQGASPFVSRPGQWPLGLP